jgi:hypothetical protein
LRIHDILVRIRICGSIPLTNGCGSCYFRHWPSRQQQKILIFLKLCFFLLKVHLHHFSKIKSQKDVTKQQESRFFLLFPLDDRRILIRTSDLQIRMREAQKERIRRIRIRNTGFPHGTTTGNEPLSETLILNLTMTYYASTCPGDKKISNILSK